MLKFPTPKTSVPCTVNRSKTVLLQAQFSSGETSEAFCAGGMPDPSGGPWGCPSPGVGKDMGKKDPQKNLPNQYLMVISNLHQTSISYISRAVKCRSRHRRGRNWLPPAQWRLHSPCPSFGRNTHELRADSGATHGSRQTSHPRSQTPPPSSRRRQAGALVGTGGFPRGCCFWFRP